MKKKIKKSLSVIMIVVLCLTMAPLQGLEGLNISSLFASEAKAAGITDSDGETYWAMSHDEAVNFIGFIYDRSKLTEEELNAGGLYTFLTGGFERGSIEEYSAKLAFLMTAKSNLSQCFNSYSQVADEARQYLYDYLIDQVDVGSLTLDGAEEVVDTIIFYSSEIIEKLGTDVADILNILEKAKKYNDSLTNVDAYVDNLFATFNGFVYMWGSSKSAMYQYVSSYIQNRSLKNSCSDAFELLNDYNKFALVDGSLYDPFLDWASDDHIAILESFGDYIYFVSKSFKYNGSVFDPTDDLSEYKVIDVQCPTDVYVYNKAGELLLSIVDNEILNISTNISASVYDNKKRVALPLSCEYDVVIKGTDEGVMDYYIYEIFNDSIMRTVEHNSIPLTEGCTYTTTIPEEVYTDVANYNMISENGEEIVADYDSLPPIEDNIVDVIVAEELFDGFSVEIIDLVADAMFNMKSVVDLSAYDISTDDSVALFSAVAKYYPAEYSLIANSDFTYKIIVSPNLDRIMKIRFYYGDDANLSTYQKRVNDLNAEIDALVAKVEGMNEFEKALYIHDYIVLNSEYDLELLEYMEANNCILPGELRSEKYTEYSIFVNGTGVCGSYALAYRAVMNAAGMECLYLSSGQMNHAWNLVKIDGNWYHVDCCWDDPVPDTYGRAGRTYFLRTDNEMMNLNHYSWTPGQYKASSEKYSDMPRNYDIKQKYDDGKWYYLEGSKLYSSDTSGKNETEITSISASSIDVDDGIVYFSNGRYIYEYDIETEKISPVYMLSKKDSGDKPTEAYLSNIYVYDDSVEFYKSIHKAEKRITVYDTDTLHREKFAAITGIEISHSQVSLNVFETLQLSANIITTGSAEDFEVEWYSSDDSVVSVDNKGKIIAANVGSAVITATLLDHSVNCEVKVTGDGLSGMCGDNAYWKFEPDIGKLLISGSGAMTDYISAGYYDGAAIPWYDLKKKINDVIIGSGISSIARGSFSNCNNLETISIPDTVTKISENSFSYCKNLSEINIPDGVSEIGDSAFYYCSSIKAINIPKTVTSIGETVFYSCSELEFISVDTNNTSYFSDEYGCLYGLSLFTRKPILKQYPVGSKQKCFKMPNDVVSIQKSAFYEGKYLEEIVIAESVTSIGDTAFYKCGSLKSIYIPSGVQAMGYGIWGQCSNLETVVFSEEINCTEIPQQMFDRCRKLVNISLPNTITSIESYAFNGCESLSNIVIPNTVTNIGSRAFSGTNLLELTISDNVSVVDSRAFADCNNLENVYIGTGVGDLEDSAFAGCKNLKEIKVSTNNEKYSEVDGVVFNKDKTTLVIYPDGKLDDVYTIPDSVKTICTDTFYNCDNLKTLIISKNVERLGRTNGYTTFVENKLDPDLFLDLNQLMNIVVDEENKNFSSVDGVLYNKDKSLLIKYPNNKDDVVFNIPSYVKYVFPYAFSNTINLRSLIVPETVEQISQESPYFFYSELANNSIEYMFIDGEAPVYHNQFFDYSSLKKLYSKNFLEGTNMFYISNIRQSVTIYGQTSTFAEEYSTENGNKFVDIEAQPHIHDYFLMGYSAPSETEDGYELWECYCRKDSYKTILHYYGEAVVTTPSCVIDGDISKACFNCGEVSIVEKIPAIGKHTYQIVSTVPGTCTTAPLHTYTCSACGDTYTKEGRIEEGHSYETTVIAPTCEEKGYTKEVCTVCGETTLSDFTSPKGHEFVINKSADYCSAHGTLEYSCKNCDYTESVVSDEADLVTETVTVEPTCTKSGSESEICKLCGATVSVKMLNPLSHEYSDEYTVDVEASCTSSGQKSQHCIRCDAKRAVTTIEAAGHQNTGIINAADATCTNNGYTGDTYCSDCKTVIVTGESTSKLTHNYNSVITAPTCTSKGFTIHTCTACGDNYTDGETQPIEHSYSSVVTPVTCTSNGYTAHTCIVCSYSYTSDTVPSTGHNYNDDGICTGCGKNRTENCSHMCHKSGLMGFIWKILRFFFKLFKIQPTCSCGVAHY